VAHIYKLPSPSRRQTVKCWLLHNVTHRSTCVTQARTAGIHAPCTRRKLFQRMRSGNVIIFRCQGRH